MKKFSKSSVIFFLTLSFSGYSNSQDLSVSQISETDFFSDFPVVLTATRLKQPKKDAPIATTIIDRKMIEASGFTEVADLLRLAPNTIVNYDGKNVPAVGYSYLYDRYTVRMQVLVDGRSVYTPIFGEVYWNSLGISVDDIERIEVIRGPSSASYGPNAMMGVISIITKNTNIDEGTTIKLKSGKDGIQEQYIKIADSSGDISYRLSLTARKNNGFEERFDHSNIDILNFKTNYQVDNNDEIDFNITYNSAVFGIHNLFTEDDAITSGYNLHPKRNSKVKNKSHQIKWTHTFNNENNFNLNYYQQEHEVFDDHWGTADGFGDVLSRHSLKSIRNNLEFSHLLSGEDYMFTWGAVYRTDETVAPLYLYNVKNNKVETNELYFNSSYNINQDNTLNIGYMYDNNDIADSSTSTRISLNHHIDDKNTIRASYATSTRTPFIFEERTNYIYTETIIDYPVFFDKEDLSAEEIESYDLGFYMQHGKSSLDIRLFKNKLTSLIYTDDEPVGANPDTDYFINGEGFEHKGFELSLGHEFEKAWFHASYAHNNIYNIHAITTNPSNYDNATPFNIFSLIAGANITDSSSISFNYYYTDKMKSLLSEQIQDSQNHLNLKLGTEFKVLDSKAELSLVVFNITDKELVIPFRSNERNTPNSLRRSGYISFKMDF